MIEFQSIEDCNAKTVPPENTTADTITPIPNLPNFFI